MPEKIYIKGVIISDDEAWIYEWLDITATCPKVVNEFLQKANGEAVEVYINSPGGSVFSGSEIYTALKEYSGITTGKIIGVAASAASVIAMGCRYLYMSPTSQMMIHNVSGTTRGDYRAMEHSAAMLKDYNSTLANAYVLKSGLSKKDILLMMDRETWLTPEKALSYKLIDGILFKNETDPLKAESQAKLGMLTTRNSANTELAAVQLKLLKLKNVKENRYE